MHDVQKMINLESAVDRDFLAQQIDLDGVGKNFVVTLLVIREFLPTPNELRCCVQNRDSTADSRLTL